MTQINHAEYGKGGIEIVHEDPEDNFVVRQVRGGILWPTGAAHGYLCIIGEKLGFKKAKRPLVLLAEHMCQLPKDLISTICNETRRLMCRDLFCDVNDNTYGFIDALDVHVKKYRFGNVNLDAPYLTDWINGLLSIQQWLTDKCLEVSEGTLMDEQLDRVDFPDREESRRGPFFALDALRCVIGSFERPAIQPMPIKKGPGYLYA